MAPTYIEHLQKGKSKKKSSVPVHFLALDCGREEATVDEKSVIGSEVPRGI